jgi:uncharacterized protein YbjT (DUF2867 family)
VARVLIVGCGCRGQLLTRELVAGGYAVRGTTRDPDRAPAIAAAGAEPYVGDPGRLATLVGALDAVGVLCWLLAGATGDADDVAALHGPRLQTMLEEVVDTPVRGVVYEAKGTVDGGLLEAGADIAAEASRRWSIPLARLDADPRDVDGWVASARAAIDRLVA